LGGDENRRNLKNSQEEAGTESLIELAAHPVELRAKT
jgi:hypothetical protein